MKKHSSPHLFLSVITVLLVLATWATDGIYAATIDWATEVNYPYLVFSCDRNDQYSHYPYEISNAYFRFTDEDSFFLSIFLMGVLNEESGVVTIFSPNQTELADETNWIVSEKGDTVDATNTRNQEAYFFHNLRDDGEEWLLNWPCDTPITFDNASSHIFYLGFATRDQTGIHYGWAEFLAEGIDISFRQALIDLSGAPVIVGVIPIPEPSSAALLVLGLVAACVARCKRNRNTP